MNLSQQTKLAMRMFLHNLKKDMAGLSVQKIEIINHKADVSMVDELPEDPWIMNETQIEELDLITTHFYGTEGTH
jgi:hypothetical protein